MTPTINSFFSGGGFLDLGLKRSGCDVQASYEIDPVCCKVLRHNFGPSHDVVESDITKKLVANEKPCHGRVFTWPCPRYSLGAQMHGTRTGDDLYLHGLRHMVVDPPEVWAAENVPGMRKFKVVMEALTRLSGYYVTVFCPISSQTWLPQKRDRLFIIGSRRNFQWRPPEATTPVKLRDILEENPQVHIPEYVYRRIKGKYRDKPIVSDPERDDIAPTCVAHYSKDRSTRLVKDKNFPFGVRPYTLREWARLQGVPDSYEFPCTYDEGYKIVGNGVSVPAGEWLGNEFIRYFNS